MFSTFKYLILFFVLINLPINLAQAKKLFACYKINVTYGAYHMAESAGARPHTSLSYAICQILHGDKAIGAGVLDRETELGNVNAAYVLAKYIGTKDGSLDAGSGSMSYRFDELAQAFLRVLATIDGNPDYINDFYGEKSFSVDHQVELDSLGSAPYAFFNSFTAGFDGDHALRKYESPSYKGSRELKFWPGFTSYTISNLEKTIEFSNRCLAIRKKPYFIEDTYQITMKWCQELKRTATKILPLELKRLALTQVGNSPCRRDLLACKAYTDLYQEIDELLITSYEEIQLIFSSVSR